MTAKVLIRGRDTVLGAHRPASLLFAELAALLMIPAA